VGIEKLILQETQKTVYKQKAKTNRPRSSFGFTVLKSAFFYIKKQRNEIELKKIENWVFKVRICTIQ
jgi:hypothetical protein